MSLLQIGKRKKAEPKLTDRTYLSVSSEGYGHSSRALAIARYLKPEECLIGTYSYALERVKSKNIPAVAVPQELKFVGEQGSFDVGKTIFQNQTKALIFNQIVQDEMDIIKNNGISLVVADGRMAPVLAASRLEIPCLVLTNQSAFYPFFERESDLVKFFGRSFEWVMKLWLCSSEEILIPDFPPPNTVCLANLSHNYQVMKRTRFVGPLVAWQAHEITPVNRDVTRPMVVVSVGGHAYRKPMFDAVIEAAKSLTHIQFEIIAPFSTEVCPSNVTLHQKVIDTAAFFKAADLIITQAGHSTAMEVLTLGKPTLIIPDTRQIEQENNARRMAELGVAMTLDYEALQDPKQKALINTIQTLLNTSSYQERASQLAEEAAQINGAASTANYLREFSHRLLAY